MMTSRSHGRMMKFSVSSAAKSGWKSPVRNETAVFTAAGLSSRTAARASFMVAPVSHVSSTLSTRRPVTMRGGPAITTGRAPASVRVMATDAKSRCRMLATTAPGITPALAMPITTSGSYSRKILSASARHISPKNGQSTSKTPWGVLRPLRRFGDEGVPDAADMGGEATLQSHATASYFRPMGFWRRLFGGSWGDELNPQRLDYLNEALALERQGDYDAALTSYRLALRDHPNAARSSSTGTSRAPTTDSRSCCSSAATRTGRRSTCAPSSPTRPRAPTRRSGSSMPPRRSAISAPRDRHRPPRRRRPEPSAPKGGPVRRRRSRARGGRGVRQAGRRSQSGDRDLHGGPGQLGGVRHADPPGGRAQQAG